MDLEQAKQVIRTERDGRVFRQVRAAAVLCASENSDRVTLQELIECITLGNRSKELALIAEYAALALYTRTQRPRRAGHSPFEDFITDPEDWIAYLKQRRLI